MEINCSDVYVYAADSWGEIVTYRVLRIEKDSIILAPSDEIFSEKNTRTVPRKDESLLGVYPFSFYTFEKHERLAKSMSTILDLVCAMLGKHKTLSLEKLTEILVKNKDKYKFSDEHAPWILRCLVASKAVVAKQKGAMVTFALSPSQEGREKKRKFSASIASELAALSERVRYIIDHGPTVGTYRESLLQNVLKKHLPERYHVATGFIYGLGNQIDILIYDRVDYAPLFREGDLVIVPPESVRAVIEVKTSLTKEKIQSALELLDRASRFDDNEPPFFKGIFAFESSLKTETIYELIGDFYTDIHVQAQGGPGTLIHRPFQQLTCACVIGKLFAYTKYVKNGDNRLVPVLYSKNSLTELESQTSLFMQSLLAHLKFGGMKPFKIDYMGRMLGEDTVSERVRDLTEGHEGGWGAYFHFDEGDVEEHVVEQMEKLILAAQQWLDGEENFSA